MQRHDDDFVYIEMRRDGGSMRWLALAMLLAVCTSASGQGWVCAGDKAAGFKLDSTTKSWVVANFSADEKFLITKSDQPNEKWVVKRLGEKFPVSYCTNDFTKDGNLLCQGFETFRFNKLSLRFLSAYLIGYGFEPEGQVEGRNTPMLIIGKCSPM